MQSIRGRQAKRRRTKYKRNLTIRKLKKTLENGEFFSQLKALWDQGLRGRGSKMIKYERWEEKLTGQTAKPCSIGIVTYTATTNPESTVSKRTDKDNKGVWVYSNGCNDNCERNHTNEQRQEGIWVYSNGCNENCETSHTNEQRRKGWKYSNSYKRHPGEKKPKGDYKLV